MTYEFSTELIIKRDMGYYKDALDIAIKNDDTLSIIKDLLVMAYSQYQKSRDASKEIHNLLSEDYERLLLKKMGKVEAKSLSKAFGYFYHKYFNHGKV